MSDGIFGFLLWRGLCSTPAQSLISLHCVADHEIQVDDFVYFIFVVGGTWNFTIPLPLCSSD